MKKILTILFIVLSMITLKGQKVKFTNINYEVISCDSNKQFVDSVTFIFAINYKNVNYVSDEINYVEWGYGYVGDTIIAIHSRISFSVEKGSVKYYPFNEKNCSIEVKGNKCFYKVGIKDLLLPEISYVNFNVEYTQKYHMKYHYKKPYFIGRIKEVELIKAFDDKKRFISTCYK